MLLVGYIITVVSQSTQPLVGFEPTLMELQSIAFTNLAIGALSNKVTLGIGKVMNPLGHTVIIYYIIIIVNSYLVILSD